MKILEIMSTPVTTVTESTTLETIARLMLDRNIGGVPVVNSEGRLCGIVTESDFTARKKPVPFSLLTLSNLFGHWLHDAAEQAYREARFITADQVMTDDVLTVTEDDSVEVALRHMCDRRVHRLPVVRAGVPVGMVTRQDLIRLMVTDRLPLIRPTEPVECEPPAPPANGPWTRGN